MADITYLDPYGIGRTVTISGGGGGGIGGSTGTTDNRVLRADGTGGATVQGSAVAIDDSGNMTGIGNITLSGTIDGVDLSVLATSTLTSLSALTMATGEVPYFSTGSASSTFPSAAGGRALVGLNPGAADLVPYFTSSTAAGVFYCRAQGRTFLAESTVSGQRTALGLGSAATTASTDYQPADAELTAIAGLTSAADTLPYFTGSGTAALATMTSAGRALLDDATAADQRTTLGLGTAATTASTDYQATNTNLTAIAGLTTASDKMIYWTGAGAAALSTINSTGRSLLGLTWAAGTQVPIITGAGSTALLTVGTATNNLVQLGSGAKLPAVDGSLLTNLSNSQIGGAVYPADSWTYQWVTGTGDPLSNGWAQAGTVNVTTASATQAGVGCFSLTPGGTSGTSSLKYSTTAAAGNWELRLKVYLPASSGTTNNFGFAYNPDTTQTGSKRFQYMFTSSTSSSITYWTGTAMGTLVTTPSLTGRWVDITIRTYVTSTGLANTWQELWIGKTLVWSGMAPSSLGATSPAAGDIVIGRMTASTTVSVIYIAEVSFLSGINVAPPSHTFSAATWPL